MESASDGQQAVDLFKAGTFELVLMDIQMPNKDGLTATREIRQWEKDQGLVPKTIVALTAYAFKSDIERCIEAGCDKHISKPIKKSTLMQFLLIFNTLRY